MAAVGAGGQAAFAPPGPGPARRRVLFLTDNGHGLGHVTRLLAMATRCPDELEPVFLTMSASHHLIAEAGFPVEYLPSAARWGVQGDDWADLLARKLTHALARLRPDVLVVDHVRPSAALRVVAERFPGVRLVWVRRGLWRRGRNADALDLAPVFDAIIEPLDVAVAIDAGLTTVDLDRVVHVPPVTLLDREQLLSRGEARAAIDLEPDRPAVLVNLSADGPDELSALIGRATRALVATWGDDVQIVAPDHALYRGRLDVPDRVRLRAVYPLARYLDAFDLGIATAGYNSYHEVVMAGLPCVFVPRLTSTMDDQQRRAEHARLGGYGWYVASLDDPGLESVLRDARDPLSRRRVAAALRAVYPGNGAAAAAATLAQLASTTGRRGGGPAWPQPSADPVPSMAAPSGRVVVDASHLDDAGVRRVVGELRDGGATAGGEPVVLVPAALAPTAQELEVLHETLLPADVLAQLDPGMAYADYVQARLRELAATSAADRVITDTDEVS